MSATAVVPSPRLRNDLAACRQHFVARLLMIVRDPFALGILAFAGVATVPLWCYWLGISPAFAHRYPWPGGVVYYDGPVPTATQLAFYSPDVVVVIAQLLWAALVAWTLGGESGRRRSSASARGALPALPIGRRARLVADALVGLFVLLLARTVVVCVWGGRLGEMFFPAGGVFPEAWRGIELLFPHSWRLAAVTTHASIYAAFVSASGFVISSLLGTLLVFPLVLAWSAMARLDWRALLKPALATLLLFGALSVGAMAWLVSALPICVLVAAFLLVRLDDGSRSSSPSITPALRFRKSIGALRELRRDACLGPLRGHGQLLVLALGLPILLTVLWRTKLFGHPASPELAMWLSGLAFFAALAQWLSLMALSLFPFGLALVSSATASSLFGGSFLRSWGVLPVPRESVIRVVYVHGLLVAGFAWLVLLIQARLRGVPFDVVLYELPTVFLIAGLAVCEAVGDRKRGLLAVGALVAFQLGLPLSYLLYHELTPGVAPHGLAVGVAGYTAALAGALPPLVHLRGRHVASAAGA